MIIKQQHTKNGKKRTKSLFDKTTTEFVKPLPITENKTDRQNKSRSRSRSKSTPRKMSKSDQNENNETTTEIETLEIHPSPWSSLNEPRPEYEYDAFLKDVIDKFRHTDENKQKEILQNLDLKTTEELIDWLNQNPFNISALDNRLKKKQRNQLQKQK